MSTDDRLSLSRRHFLLSVLSGLAAASTLHGCGSTYNRSLIASRLSQTIGDQTAAKRFGASYLRSYPDEAEVEILVRQIDAALISEYGQGMNIDDPLLLAKHLDQQIRNEFSRGDVVQVDGWILSRSETRLYALMALL